MRIAVTGATGNVGTALLRRWAGRHDVLAVTRRPPAHTEPYVGVRWVGCDVGDPAAMSKLIDAFDGAEAVVHLAWQLQPGWPGHGRRPMRRTNLVGTHNVAQAAVAVGARHLVHLSSLGAYAPSPTPRQPATETHPVTGVPGSPYSQDKAEAEQLLEDFADRLAIARLRPTLILQPAAAGEISRYFLGPLLGARVPRQLVRPATLRLLPWPRELALQFVHADDVAAALDLVIEQRVEGGLNVAADPVVDRAGWTAAVGGVGPPLPPAVLRAVMAAAWRLRLQPTEPGWLDLATRVPVLDTTRLRDLGWSPEHDGLETLGDFLAALRRGEGGRGALLYPAGSDSRR